MTKPKSALPLTFVPFDYDLYRSSIRRFFDIATGDGRSFFKALNRDSFAIFTPPENAINYEFPAGLFISIDIPELTEIVGNNSSSFGFENVKTIEEAEEIANRVFTYFEPYIDGTGKESYTNINIVENIKRFGGRIYEFYEFVKLYSDSKTRVSLIKTTHGAFNDSPEEISYYVTIENKKEFSPGYLLFTENRETSIITSDFEFSKAVFRKSVIEALEIES